MGFQQELSSPGDVVAERDAADDILTRLERSPAWRGKFRFEIVRWDDPHAAVPMDAHYSPQEAINRKLPKPSECDVVVVMLWSRFGTPLGEPKKPDGSAYLSGTEWEFEDGLRGQGEVLLFRRTDEPVVRLADPEYEVKRQQYLSVQRFFEQFRRPDGSLTGSFITYDGAEAFGKILQQTIEGVLRRVADTASAEATAWDPPGRLRPPSAEPPLPDRPYPLLQPYRHPATVAAAVAAVLTIAVGWFAYTEIRTAFDREALNTAVVELVGASSPQLRALDGLVSMYPAERMWSSVSVEPQRVNPAILAGPSRDGGPEVSPERILDIVERVHPAFIRSRLTFGAMAYVVEDVGLRHPELRPRANALWATVRSAFVAAHGIEPPTPEEDGELNPRVPIRGGEFEMGTMEDLTPEDGSPHRVRVSDFMIQKYEVTNQEYKRFDPGHSFPAGEERHPAANVSWYEAFGYAAWLGGTLPTEAQWEFAARGSAGRPYPWGNEIPTTERARYSAASTVPVGSLPKGATPETDIHDLAGNVWEWCRDWYAAYPSEKDPLDPRGPPAGRSRVVRGGSVHSNEGGVRAAIRNYDGPDLRDIHVGFRVVVSRF